MRPAEGFGDQVWFDAWHEAFAPTARRYPLRLAGRDCRVELVDGSARVLRRCWRFLQAPVNAHSPRYGWRLTDRPTADDLSQDLGEALRTSGAHGIELNLVPEGTGTLDRLLGLGATGRWIVAVERVERSAVIDVTGTWARYLEVCARRFRKMSVQERQLGTLGVLTFRDVHRDDDWQSWFEKGLRLEMSGWKGRAGAAILQRPNEVSFYRRVACAAAEKGCLRLFLLSLGDRLVAFFLTIAEDGILYWLKTAFDERLARYSPGTLLVRRSLMECFADPSVEAVNLPGAPEWMQQWPSRVEWLLRVRVVPKRSLVGGLLMVELAARNVWPWSGRPLGPKSSLAERGA